MKWIHWLIIGLAIAGALAYLSAESIPIYLKPLNGTALMPSQNFNYTLNFTTASDCTGIILSHQEEVTTGTDGVAFVEVNYTSPLTNIPSYLCEYRDGVLRKTHNLSSQTFYTTYIQNITGLTANITGNLYAGNKLVNEWLYNHTTITLAHVNTINTTVNMQNLLNSTGIYSTYNSSYIPYTGSNQVATLGNYNFSVNGTAFFVNANTGNVGIGTTSPVSKLNIVTTTNNDGLIIHETDGANYAVHLATYTNGGQLSLYGDSIANIFMSGRPNVNSYFNSGGNVGIGATSPQRKLDINGSMALLKDSNKIYLGTAQDISISYDGSRTQFTNEVGAGEWVFSSGNVGIGTTDPKRLLHISNTGATQLMFSDSNAGNNLKHKYMVTADGKFYFGKFNDTYVAKNQVVIDNDGLLGINTTSPTHTLNVVGNMNVTGLPLAASTATSMYVCWDGGAMFLNETGC